MINRQRRHQPGGESGSSPSSGSHSSPRHHAYNIADGSVDEEANKGKKSHFHMFRPTLSSFRRVCLNPRATLPLKCSGTSTSATPAPHQGRRRLLSQFLILSFVCVVLSWTRRRRLHHPFRHQSAWSLENSPLLIKLFDFSDVKDIGGWHYHTQQFHSISSLEPITIPNLADYGGLTFSSLSKSPPSKFRRTISPDDYMINEEYKRQVLDKNKAKKGFDDIYYQQPEEVLSLECRRQNWQGLTFPTCNDFHEVDLSRDYDPHAKVLDHLGYYDSYRIRYVLCWLSDCDVILFIDSLTISSFLQPRSVSRYVGVGMSRQRLRHCSLEITAHKEGVQHRKHKSNDKRYARHGKTYVVTSNCKCLWPLRHIHHCRTHVLRGRRSNSSGQRHDQAKVSGQV